MALFSVIGNKKRKKGHPHWKGRNKTIFTSDMICVLNLKFITKLLKLISGFSKVSVDNINIEKLTIFLYTKNEYPKMKLKAVKKMK